MNRPTKKPDRQRKHATRTVARLLTALDKTLAAAEETKKFRKELDRLASLSLSRQEAKP
jgi:hypothetical protein